MIFDILLLSSVFLVLIILAYKKANLLVSIPIIIIIIVLIIGDKPIMYYIGVIYSEAIGTFIKDYILLFIFGAIFGRIISDSGAALSISKALIDKFGVKYAILIIALSSTLFSYSGISTLISIFIIYPIAKNLFYELNIPKKLIPAVICFGSYSFSMAIPGNLQLSNVIPSQYLGTSLYSAPFLSMILVAFIFSGGIVWLYYRQRYFVRKGIGYYDSDAIDKYKQVSQLETRKTPRFYLAISPIVLVIVGKIVLLNLFFAKQDPALYGVSSMDMIQVKYSVVSILFIVSFIYLFIFRRYLISIRDTLNTGISQSLMPIILVGCLIGYGKVLINLGIFNSIIEFLADTEFAPSIIFSIIMAMFSVLSGSSVGGTVIGFEYIFSNSELYNTISQIDKGLVHRLSTVASTALSSLPHNGGIVPIIALSKLSYKKTYGDIFVVSFIFPLLGLILFLSLINLIF